MAINLRLLLVVATIAAAVVMMAQAALAQGKAVGHGDTRPGWGHGDKNHVHTGPPGSVRP